MTRGPALREDNNEPDRGLTGNIISDEAPPWMAAGADVSSGTQFLPFGPTVVRRGSLAASGRRAESALSRTLPLEPVVQVGAVADGLLF